MAQLYFYYSAMNAGKSTSLLQSSFNYRERGMKTTVYTAELDNRYGVGKVTSRVGLETDATLFNKSTDIFKQVKAEPVNCVLIDEAQFLSKDQVQQLTMIADELDIPVLCYGLRTDFKGELFIGSQYLLAWADKLVELKTICHCGRKASMVLRINNGKPIYDGEQIVIGGNDSYVSVCRNHYYEGKIS